MSSFGAAVRLAVLFLLAVHWELITSYGLAFLAVLVVGFLCAQLGGAIGLAVPRPVPRPDPSCPRCGHLGSHHGTVAGRVPCVGNEDCTCRLLRSEVIDPRLIFGQES